MIVVKDISQRRTKICFWRNHTDPSKIEVGTVYSFTRLMVDKFPPAKPHYLKSIKQTTIRACRQEVQVAFESVELADGKIEGKL